MKDRQRPSIDVPAGMQAARFYGKPVLLTAAGRERRVRKSPYAARQIDALRVFARERQDALAREPLSVEADIYIVA